MKREDLEKYLGKMAEITIFDDSVYKGCLRKTQDEMFKNDANLYIPKNLYFVTESKESKICTSCLFKTSHVIKIKFYYINLK